MTLCVTGGRFKGHRLTSPSLIRPTSEKLRKAIFDICQNEIEDASFLDLYAGSGLIGIEAISRGARSVTFVEKFSSVAQYLIKNIKTLKIDNQCTLMIKPAVEYLKSFSTTKNPLNFNLIYIDPPYGEMKDMQRSEGDLLQILALLDALLVIPKCAKIFVEFSKHSKMQFDELCFEHLIYFKRRDYGTTIVHEFHIKQL